MELLQRDTTISEIKTTMDEVNGKLEITEKIW